MFRDPADRRRRPRRRRRRNGPLTLFVLASLAVLGLIVFAVANASESPPSVRRAGVVQIAVGDRKLARMGAPQLLRLRSADLQRWLSRIPGRRRERRGVAVVILQTDRPTLRRRVRRAAIGGGGTVQLPARPIASAASLPVVKQALRNNCETAALSILLRARGVRVGQLELQRQVSKSAPLDPRGSGSSMVWGDPQLGFVGRAEGGGPFGGYGVYQRPIKQLARRHRVRLADLSGRGAGAVYSRLLSGRPLMAWVGLMDGPYQSWRTPSGKRVNGNLNEHAVVLTGISRAGRLAVNDPLTGEREQWSKAEFESMWRRLGRRALSS